MYCMQHAHGRRCTGKTKWLLHIHQVICPPSQRCALTIGDGAPKEVHHFDVGCGVLSGMNLRGSAAGRSCEEYGLNWAKQQANAYASCFEHNTVPGGTCCRLMAEATPSYLFDIHAASRMKNTFPSSWTYRLRFVAILREPVSRDFSMYRMLVDKFWYSINQQSSRAQFWRPPNNIVFDVSPRQYTIWSRWRMSREAIQPYSSTLSYGKYKHQLRKYIDEFGAGNIFVINFLQFINEYSNYMSALASFIGVSNVWRAGSLTNLNPRRPYTGNISRLSRYANDSVESKPRSLMNCENGGCKTDIEQTRGTLQIGSTICNELSEYYMPHNAMLYQLLQDFKPGSVHGFPPLQPDFDKFPPPPCIT